ncbi:MAG: replication-associated recombination protein A [bacterium]
MPKQDMPLAVRMRPRTIDEFVGQAHILSQGKLLRRAIEADRITSLILYGPPGCGKTTLSQIIANTTKSFFGQLNAVTSGVAEIRKFLADALERKRRTQQKTSLLIEEIHRFSKPQQDALLPDVEHGNVVLIGTTTANPFFTISSPLISRSQVFELKPLSIEELRTILIVSLQNEEQGLGQYRVDISPEAVEHLIDICDGDARRMLTALEIGVITTLPDKEGIIQFTLKTAEESIQKKAIVYDQKGDNHYDTISAFIKSMRGSNPDAALYWLAKMLCAGEDPRFIVRRMVICAAEDVGNADPHALLVAHAAAQSLEYVGLPEAEIIMAHAVTYIASAPKSNASYVGIKEAKKDVEMGRTMGVPTHLKESHYPGAKILGHGEGYKYSHDYQGHFVKQEYIPSQRVYYHPSDQGYEIKIKERLKKWRG